MKFVVEPQSNNTLALTPIESGTSNVNKDECKDLQFILQFFNLHKWLGSALMVYIMREQLSGAESDNAVNIFLIVVVVVVVIHYNPWQCVQVCYN